RPIDHRNFVVPLNIPPHEEVTIFMRLKTTRSVQVPISLWEERAFFSAETRTMAAEGVFYGGLLIIAIYNLLLLFALRFRVYLYDVRYFIGIDWFFVSLRAWTVMWLWLEATAWDDKATVFFLFFLVLFTIAFVSTLLDVAPLFRSARISLHSLLPMNVL